MTDYRTLLEWAMDLEAKARKLADGMETRVSVPVIETDGITTRVKCVCGQPIEYHDNYCRQCGRMQIWTGRK